MRWKKNHQAVQPTTSHSTIHQPLGMRYLQGREEHGVAAQRVDPDRDRFEVARVGAAANAALMIEDETARHRSDQQLVDDLVKLPLLAVPPHPRVAVRAEARAGVEPAAAVRHRHQQVAEAERQIEHSAGRPGDEPTEEGSPDQQAAHKEVRAHARTERAVGREVGPPPDTRGHGASSGAKRVFARKRRISSTVVISFLAFSTPMLAAITSSRQPASAAWPSPTAAYPRSA